MSETDPRQLLGAFIRTHRERLPPPLRATGRRRTPGLRREELADAAGLGVTWITWLEQGREVNPSVGALARLAEALQLSSAERASLFDLAGKRDPEASAQDTNELAPDLLALPDQFRCPAYLLDRDWTARAWNAAAADLFPGWLDAAATDRNLLNYVFLSEAARSLIGDWPQRAHRLVAEFRADFNRAPLDPALREQVDSLSRRSPLFAELWRNQEVLAREGGERTFLHPERGELHLQQTTLLVAQRPELKLVCLSALR